MDSVYKSVLLPCHSTKDMVGMFNAAVRSPAPRCVVDATARTEMSVANVTGLARAYKKARQKVAAKARIVIRTSNRIWAGILQQFLRSRKNITVEFYDPAPPSGRQ